MLRLDINLLFAVINLIILIVAIRIFLFKPIKKVIAKRREEVEQEYADAETAKKEADALKSQYDTVLAGASAEATGIVKESRNQAGAEYERIIADAKKEAAGIVAAAEEKGKQIEARSVIEAKEGIADMVAEATAKLAASKQSPEADMALLDQFLAEAEKKA